MTGYVDASALLKLYVAEPDTDEALAAMRSVETWATARHTLVEVRRNLARLLDERNLAIAQEAFAKDWQAMLVVELDEVACLRAAELAEQTGVKTLDALHLGAAAMAGADDGLPIVTFDSRMGSAARSLGWTVLGA